MPRNNGKIKINYNMYKNKCAMSRKNYFAPLARLWSSAITCGCANRGNREKPDSEKKKKNENYLDHTQAES